MAPTPSRGKSGGFSILAIERIEDEGDGDGDGDGDNGSRLFIGTNRPYAFSVGVNKDMRFSALVTVFILAQAAYGAASAQTTLYKAVCKDSSFKDADSNTDLSQVPGVPISCVGVTVSMLANERVSVQFVVPGQSILGFGGDKLDEKSDPKFITLPLKRVYLPGKAKSDVPLTVEGIEGACLLDGKGVRALTGIICIAKLESGSRRQIYEVHSLLQGVGQTIPLTGTPSARKP